MSANPHINTTDFSDLDAFPADQLNALLTAFLDSKGICTDSRKLQSGEIFIALKGGNFDGNLFGLQALEQGASLSVIDSPEIFEQAGDHQRANLLLVENGLTALQALARAYRRQLKAPVLAITGSNGKTTTKELLAAVISTSYKCSATAGNFNNHIGVPLTLLSIQPDCEFAIIEMGANHQREIAGLCAIAEPDFGLITNIGSAHLEGFGGYEGVKKGKGEMYDFLKASDGLIFRFSGQEELADLAADYPQQVTYGFDEDDFVWGTADPGSFFAALAVTSGASGSRFSISTKLVGNYNLPNILAAVCVGLHQGISINKIQEALSSYQPANNRSQLLEQNGWQIIMDAYNANPTSTLAAVQHFGAMQTDRRKVAILGDMLELGEHAAEEHAAIAEAALASGIDQVVLVGPEYKKVDLKAMTADAGNSAVADEALQFTDAVAAAKWFAALDPEAHTVLLKGSRGIGLEKVLPEGLKQA